MTMPSDDEVLDELCARFGPPLEYLWSVRKQPTVRMVDSVTNEEMRRRFERAQPLLALVGAWKADKEQRLSPSLDRALDDREDRLDLERLTVLIRRRNDSQRH
jgi:hypothetical protein